MTAVVSHTPAWLSRPSPGFAAFNAPGQNAAKAPANTSTLHRAMAARGTEVFFVVDNEIRWTDLSLLRSPVEVSNDSRRRTAADELNAKAHIVCQTQQQLTMQTLSFTNARAIEQLEISPDGSLLAIVTSHTIHIALLPNSNHLSSPETSSLKLRTFQLGPTTHVVDCAAVAAVQWHPLGASGHCLVSVTKDAVVRLWDLNTSNRSSFETPDLAIDLKKLANGRSATEDFSPSRYGMRNGFSPDSFEMEVASACFGSTGSDGWGSMTFWIAMTEGDVYVLCPLIPSSWQTSLANAQDLVSQLKLEADALAGDGESTKTMQQRLSWATSLEAALNAATDDSPTLQRPTTVPAVPKLQGPFQFSPDPDQTFDTADIRVIRSDTTEDEQLTSVELVCLSTTDAQVHVCLNLNEIRPQWLTNKRANPFAEAQVDDDIELLIIQTIDLGGSGPTLFTADQQSASRLFLTRAAGLVHLDGTELLSTLQEELVDSDGAGTEFRTGMLLDNSAISVKALMDFPSETHSLAACLNVVDEEFGYLAMTTHNKEPYLVSLDEVDRLNDTALLKGQTRDLLAARESRPPYQPPQAFWEPTAITRFVDEHVHVRTRQSLHTEIRMSPNTLKILMDAHRVLSTETHKLGVAASDLFSRCKRLQDEFRAQLTRAKNVSDMVDILVNTNENDDENDVPTSLRENVERRLNNVRARHVELETRHEDLRQRMAQLNGRPLSDNERLWSAEVAELAATVDGASNSNDDPDGIDTVKRAERAKEIAAELLTESQAVLKQESTATEGEVHSYDSANNPAWPEIDSLLDNQSALVAAMNDKLSRLEASLNAQAGRDTRASTSSMNGESVGRWGQSTGPASDFRTSILSVKSAQRNGFGGSIHGERGLDDAVIG